MIKQKIKKTVIFVGYACNNNCIFCCNSEKRESIKDKTTAEVINDLVNSRKQGSNYIEFIGGEPTIRKDIFSIVSFAKKIGFETIAFATNGRMFSNKEFAKKLINEGVNHIIFSIHGHNKKLHDSLTNASGSFEQLTEGIKNLKEMGFLNIGSNTIIIKQNYKNILDIGKFIYGLGIRNSEFIFVDPTRGGPKRNFYDIVPTYEEVSPFVNKLLEFGKIKKVKHWHIRYYPLCFVNKKYHNMISELTEDKIFHTTHLAPDFINSNVGQSRREIGRIKIWKCEKCKYNKICEGYWKEYVLNYLQKEFYKKKYKNFFSDLSKIFKSNYNKIKEIENHFFELLDKNLLHDSKPLEYSLKIDKEGFHCLRFLFFSHEKCEHKENSLADKFIKACGEKTLKKYYKHFMKYALGYDLRNNDIIKKYYFWLKADINKDELFNKFKKQFNLNIKLNFPTSDLKIISIKKNKKGVDYDFYSIFSDSDKNPISKMLNKNIPLQILQKRNNNDTILRLFHLSKEEKAKILNQNIFMYHFIRRNKSFFINNGLSLSYLTYSDNSLKFYFKIGSESELSLFNLEDIPRYNRFFITLTQDCNLDCKYCFIQKKVNSRIDLENFKLILDLMDLMDYKIKIIGLWGGEPLMLKNDIKKYLSLINEKFKRNKNFCLKLVTNGTLLTKKVLELILDKNINLSISIDGNKEAHNTNRRTKRNAGSYELILNNRKLIKKYSEKIICNPAINETNSENIINNINNIKNTFGIKKFHLEFIMHDKWNRNKLKILKQDLNNFFEWLLKKIRKGDFFYIIQLNKKILKKLGKIEDINTLYFFQNGDFSNNSWTYFKYNNKLGNIFNLEFKKEKIIPEKIQPESIEGEILEHYSNFIIANKNKPIFRKYLQNILREPLKYI